MVKPLTQDDPDELWEPYAIMHNLTVAELRAQCILVDQLLLEIIAEENCEDEGMIF